MRRYSETRRPHPLHIRAESARALPEAIEYERHLLNPLMNLADIILDTSEYAELTLYGDVVLVGILYDRACQGDILVIGEV